MHCSDAVEVERAHDGGDTELLDAHREAGHGGGEPQEGLQAGERRAQRLDCIPPEYPQCHWVGSLGCNDQCRYPWTHDARVESRVIGIDSGVSAATAASCCAILIRWESDASQTSATTTRSPRNSSNGWSRPTDKPPARCPALCTPPTLGNARVDARRRKIIWADGERLSIERSAERIRAEHPDRPRELIAISLRSWFEHRVPEPGSERQINELYWLSGRGFETVSESHGLPKNDREVRTLKLVTRYVLMSASGLVIRNIVICVNNIHNAIFACYVGFLVR